MIRGEEYSCPVEAAIDIIGGKWKPWIIWCLRHKVLRFSELQKELSGISPKILTKQLREWGKITLTGTGTLIQDLEPVPIFK